MSECPAPFLPRTRREVVESREKEEKNRVFYEREREGRGKRERGRNQNANEIILLSSRF